MPYIETPCARPIETIGRGSIQPGTKPGQLGLITLDIDGTIHGKSGVLSSDLIALVPKLQGAGIVVTFATGRSSFAAKPLAERLGINAPGVYFAGALVANITTGEVFSEALLTTSTVSAVLTAAQELGVYVELYTASNYYMGTNTTYGATHARYLGQPPTQADLNEVAASETILKIGFIVPEGKTEKDLSTMLARHTNIAYAQSYGAHDPGLIFGNLTDKTGNRECAWKALLRATNLHPDCVAAFGDAPSDSYFVGNAKFGFAVENADPSLKQRAKYATRSVDADGVSYALRHMLGW